MDTRRPKAEQAEEDGYGVDLSLGLSIGRNCRNATPASGGTASPNPNPNRARVPVPVPVAFPAMQMQYPYYPQVQYVPVLNGFGAHCMVPCWAPVLPSAGAAAEGPNLPAAPYLPSPQLPATGRQLDLNDAARPDPSSTTDSRAASSSSGVSIHQSPRLQGVISHCIGGSSSSSSSDARSHSGNAAAAEPPVAVNKDLTENFVETTPCIQMTSSLKSTEEFTEVSPCSQMTSSVKSVGVADKQVSSLMASSGVVAPAIPRKLEGSSSVNKPILAPGSEDQSTDSPSWLPQLQMPCVATTGNGPNGKTITGVLYRYNNAAEVSIVCACHGTSFSPAEFVKHAGGTDVSHPLKRIVVVPS